MITWIERCHVRVLHAAAPCHRRLRVCPAVRNMAPSVSGMDGGAPKTAYKTVKVTREDVWVLGAAESFVDGSLPLVKVQRVCRLVQLYFCTFEEIAETCSRWPKSLESEPMVMKDVLITARKIAHLYPPACCNATAQSKGSLGIPRTSCN